MFILMYFDVAFLVVNMNINYNNVRLILHKVYLIKMCNEPTINELQSCNFVSRNVVIIAAVLSLSVCD